MPTVTLNDSVFPLEDGESVLDGLLRQGQSLAHACKSGICQSCLIKTVAGAPDARATKGLKASLQTNGYALACQWVPDSDVTIALPDTAAIAVPMQIIALDPLGPGILRIRLDFSDATQRFNSHPGQYLNLSNPAGVARSYSIASDYAHDGYLELHVAQLPQGEFTTWLFAEAQVGDELYAQGPIGDCFYQPEAGCDAPILLAGTGTGLAPLYGILHDALRRQHKGPIVLLHGGSRPERLYYVDELHGLQDSHVNLHYNALVLDGAEDNPQLQQGDLAEAAIAALDPAALAQQRVFLCGDPAFVQGLRKQIFLKGVRSANIFCDAFVTRSA